MSQSGKLIFYAGYQLKDPRQALRSLVSYLRPTSIPFVSRSRNEDHGWEDFLENRDPPDNELFSGLPAGEGLDQYYKDDVVLGATLDGSPIGLALGGAVETKIDKGIRGDFALWDPVIQIGWHDLWECAEHDQGLFIARAFLSVGFFGYSTPNDWKTFRRQVFDFLKCARLKRILK